MRHKILAAVILLASDCWINVCVSPFWGGNVAQGYIFSAAEAATIFVMRTFFPNARL